MKIGNKEFPNSCPDNCPFNSDLSHFGQNSICIRCPVFVCTGSSPILEPEGYREDWAIAWKQWFDSGMVGAPSFSL
jgi:hypothetical protein